MIDYIILVFFHIPDLLLCKPDYLITGSNSNCFHLLLFREVKRFLKFKRKIVISHRLYHKINGIHFISPYRILCHICDKYDSNAVICFSKLFCSFQAVHPRHFYIKKNNIVSLSVTFQKFDAVFIRNYCKTAFFLFPIFFQISFQQPSVGCIVIYYCNPHFSAVHHFPLYSHRRAHNVPYTFLSMIIRYTNSP